MQYIGLPLHNHALLGLQRERLAHVHDPDEGRDLVMVVFGVVFFVYRQIMSRLCPFISLVTLNVDAVSVLTAPALRNALNSPVFSIRAAAWCLQRTRHGHHCLTLLGKRR